MLKNAIAAFVSGLLLASPAVADVTIVLGPGGQVDAVSDKNPERNDFYTPLRAEDFFFYAENASLDFSTAGTLTFSLAGSESGYNTTFHVRDTGDTISEASSFTAWQGKNGNPVFTLDVGAGALDLDALFFTANKGEFSGGNKATFNTAGFGIFFKSDGDKKGSEQDLTGHTEFYFAFDDSGAAYDDNHDDLLIYAKFEAAVPEPATWLMMILGFATTAVAVKRRSKMLLA